MSYRVRTKAYTGPFDLLLQLVSRQRVDIGSISISEVADQYLAEIERMQSMDLDVASDFVLVASTLLEIKSASLVPAGFTVRAQSDDDFDDELGDLSPEQARELLISRLIAYKQFRNAAASLSSRMATESRMHPRTAGPEAPFTSLMPDFLEGMTLHGMAVLAADALSRQESLLLEAEHVARKRLPVSLTIASVDRLLRERGSMSFSELLEGQPTAEALVVSFLAILELYKIGSIQISQSEPFGDIELVRVKDAPAYEPSMTDQDNYGEDSYTEEDFGEEAEDGEL
ncbi:MAG: segregation/condensation protein A [Atopobiaceae bacterium]|nr:segregation/condensation protein A [Atopobiaceae bacterium]